MERRKHDLLVTYSYKIYFKGTGEIVSVFVHDVKSSSEDKV